MKFLALISIAFTLSLTGCTIESFTFNGEKLIEDNTFQEDAGDRAAADLLSEVIVNQL